jgi:hypothetical protein
MIFFWGGGGGGGGGIKMVIEIDYLKYTIASNPKLLVAHLGFCLSLWVEED